MDPNDSEGNRPRHPRTPDCATDATSSLSLYVQYLRHISDFNSTAEFKYGDDSDYEICFFLCTWVGCENKIGLNIVFLVLASLNILQK